MRGRTYTYVRERARDRGAHARKDPCVHNRAVLVRCTYAYVCERMRVRCRRHANVSERTRLTEAQMADSADTRASAHIAAYVPELLRVRLRMCAYQPQSTCVWQGVALRAYSGVRMMAYLRPRALSRYLVQVSLTSNGVWAYVGVRRRAYGPAAVYGRVPAPANDHINECASVRGHGRRT